MPPFNPIHTEDLSQWSGAANHPNWLKVIERLAQLIGREGVAAAARASASSDESTRYKFAQAYPDEPMAAKIWLAAETRHREAFNSRMAEARTAGAAQLNTERASLDARLTAVGRLSSLTLFARLFYLSA